MNWVFTGRAIRMLIHCHRGQMLIHCWSVQTSQMPLSLHLLVSVTQVESFQITNVDKPPYFNWDQKVLSRLSHAAVHVGDFNSHHPDWGYLGHQMLMGTNWWSGHLTMILPSSMMQSREALSAQPDDLVNTLLICAGCYLWMVTPNLHYVWSWKIPTQPTQTFYYSHWPTAPNH